MTKELQNLFDGLNHLCETNEAFYFSEQEYNDKYTIRSFTYRLASWSDFQLPYAKDCRGTAFLYNKETNEWSLFCRAYKKFFNLNEGIPKEEYIQNYTPIEAYEKIDGSLILVGKIENEIVAKSKTSINSEHAKMANKLIQENPKLQRFIETALNEKYTPVFELVGQDFKIVLNYEKTELIFLGYVNKLTGEVITHHGYNNQGFIESCGCRPAETYNMSWDELFNIQETSKPDIEGYVVLCENTEDNTTEFVKVKVKSYVNLHHLKDNINNLTNLIPLILDDNLDDIIGQFQDDKQTTDYIVQTQEKIAHKFNHLVIEYKFLRGKYFNQYNEDRKGFAMKYKNHELFGYVMKGLDTSFRDIEQTAEKFVKQYLLKKCNKQENAKAFLDTL